MQSDSAPGSALRCPPVSTSTTEATVTETPCWRSSRPCSTPGCSGSSSRSTTSRTVPASRSSRPSSPPGCSTPCRARRPDPHLTLVPTEYIGTRPTSYLEDLAAGLPSDVDVMWTGPTVCSPVIRAADARAWASALAGRRPLLWDNYPVNDGTMERSLHLGPYRGREPELTDELDGVLCNPMLQPHASEVALATAAEFLCAPEKYDPAAVVVARHRRRRQVACTGAPGAGGGLRRRSVAADPSTSRRTCWSRRWSTRPAVPRGRRPCARSATTSRRHRTPGGPGPTPATIRSAAELEPWLGAAAVEAEAGLAALRLIQNTYPVAHIDCDGNGKAVGPGRRGGHDSRVRGGVLVERGAAAQARRVRPPLRLLPRCHPARRRPTGTRRRSRGRRGPVRDRPALPLRARALPGVGAAVTGTASGPSRRRARGGRAGRRVLCTRCPRSWS